LEAAEVARALTTAAFVVLTAAAVREWSVRRAPAAGWFAVSLVLISVVTVSGYVLPENSDSTVVAVLQKVDVVVVAFFPLALYRMTVALERAPRHLDVTAVALTALVVLATLAVPASDLMVEGDRSGLFVAFLVIFLFDWTFLSALVAVRLWRAGRAEPVLARRRMRALAGGALGLSAALLFAGAESPALVTQLLALLSTALFFVGFVTPRALRRPLGGHAEERFRSAVAELMGATTADEVTRALLSNATETVGGRGASLLDADREVVATHGAAPDDPGASVRASPPPR
jgi:hypothetical protein